MASPTPPSTARPQVAAPVAASMSSPAFERFAGFGGIVTGVCSVLYAIFFLLVSGPLHDYLPPILLICGGLLATAVFAAVYARVRAADAIFALWALVLGTLGQMGAAIHGVYGLASVISHAPASGVGTANPNPVGSARNILA